MWSGSNAPISLQPCLPPWRALPTVHSFGHQSADRPRHPCVRLWSLPLPTPGPSCSTAFPLKIWSACGWDSTGSMVHAGQRSAFASVCRLRAPFGPHCFGSGADP